MPALSFEYILETGQLDRAVDETLRRIKGLSDGTVSSGEDMDATFREVGKSIDKAFQDIDRATSINKQALQDLEEEYKKLEASASQAFNTGNDKDYVKITTRKDAVQGEIVVRKNLIQEIAGVADELSKEEQRMQELAAATEKNNQKQVTFRTRILNAKEALAEMELQGERGTDKFMARQAEVAKLQNAYGDAMRQATILANDEAQFRGAVSGLSGVAGGLSAATGAASLFVDENEDLQLVMTKVQSVMAITIGLQQVSETLNKDSAFSLTILSKAKQWWKTVTIQATGATVAETAALGAETTVATGATVANWSLATSFKGVGAAIMSIPGVGWLLAGLTGLIALVGHFASKAYSARKEAKEFNAEIIDGSYKAIGRIKQMAYEWEHLGESMETKNKYIKNHQKAFDDLGLSIKKVSDFEEFISDDKQVKKFIEAQKQKAMASLYFQQSLELVKKQMKLQDEISKMSDTKTKVHYHDGGNYTTSKTVNTEKIEKKKELDAVTKQIEEGYKKALKAQLDGQKALDGLPTQDNSEDTYTEGTLGYINDQISAAKKKLNKTRNNADYKEQIEFIKTLEKERDKITGGNKKKEEDPYLTMLKERKAEYERFFSWVNSGDADMASRAKDEFADLLSQGASYKEYLENQRQEILGIVDESRTEIGEKMSTMFNGNVDLLSRPMVDAAKLVQKGWENAGEGIATVFSSQYGVMDQEGNVKEILVTPILPDGTVMSEKELEDYIYNQLEGAKNILEADDKGIVIAVDVDSNGQAGDVLHQLQEQYYLSDDLSKEQKTMLTKLNNAIATETQETVLKQFSDELNKQLENAKTAMDMLNIIKKHREGLSGDGSDLDNKKADVLDKAKDSALKVQAERTAALFEMYADEKDKLLALETDYISDRLHLMTLLNKETDEKEKERIRRTLKKRKDAYNKNRSAITGEPDYQQMLVDYASFEDKKNAIVKEYTAKRNVAAENGNDEMVARLEKEMNQALSKLTLDQLKTNDMANLFGDLDDMTTDQLEKLLAKFDNLPKQQLGVELSPEDLKAISNQVDKVKGEIQERNPFKALGNSIKDYNKATDEAGKKKAMNSALESSSAIASGLSDVIGSVVDGLDKMGVELDEETQVILADIQGIADGASDVAMGIASGNPLQVIQGTITAVSSAIDMFNSGDRKAERRIKKHQQAVKKLENTYKQLEWQIDKALGSGYYDGQQDAIANLKAQQKHIEEMQREEIGKKKTNWDKVEDYKEQVREIGRQIEDIYDEISQDILQTDAKTLAAELGDALVEAFTNGEDAAEAWGATVQSVMRNAVKNQLNKNIETQMKGALDYLQKAMGFDDKGVGTFNGLTEDEMKKFEDMSSLAADNYLKALEATNGLFEAVIDDDTSLTGSIKGVSEETASILAGTTNALRINQVDGNEIMRQQLFQLEAIRRNTAYNKHLAGIHSLLQDIKSGGDMRSKGL